MRRIPIALILAGLAFPAAAAAQDPAPSPAPVPTATPAPTPAPAEPTIAAGVLAGGIDVGGLTVAEARARIWEQARPRLRESIVVRVAGEEFSLRARRLKFSFNAERSAQRAYRQGLATPPATAPDGGGTAVPVNVPLAVSYDRTVLRDFAKRVQQRSYVAPRDATVRLTLKRIFRRPSKPGRQVDRAALLAAIKPVLSDASAVRVLKAGRERVPAAVQVKDLPKRYSTIVTVDRNTFKLRLFKGLKHFKTYGVAVGAAGYETPTGQYAIQNKAVNPVWTAPNSPWAGLYAGTSVPGGAANNPLKARWLGIVNGVGIHGTGSPWSIGSRASHGCIRMTVPDVIDLYPRVPVGSLVLIK